MTERVRSIRRGDKDPSALIDETITVVQEATSKTSLTELEKGLRIDEHGLDDACREQADAYYRVAKQTALLISRRDAAAQAVKEVEAEADLRVRHLAQQHDEKITEAEVKSEVRVDREVKKANQELLALSAQVGAYQALEKAFTQRSHALNHLVDLYLKEYHSGSEGRASSNLATANSRFAKERLNERRRGLERDSNDDRR